METTGIFSVSARICICKRWWGKYVLGSKHIQSHITHFRKAQLRAVTLNWVIVILISEISLHRINCFSSDQLCVMLGLLTNCKGIQWLGMHYGLGKLDLFFKWSYNVSLPITGWVHLGNSFNIFMPHLLICPMLIIVSELPNSQSWKDTMRTVPRKSLNKLKELFIMIIIWSWRHC